MKYLVLTMTTGGCVHALCLYTYNSHRPPLPRCILANVLFFPFSNSPPPIHFLIFPAPSHRPAGPPAWPVHNPTCQHDSGPGGLNRRRLVPKASVLKAVRQQFQAFRHLLSLSYTAAVPIFSRSNVGPSNNCLFSVLRANDTILTMRWNISTELSRYPTIWNVFSI